MQRNKLAFYLDEVSYFVHVTPPRDEESLPLMKLHRLIMMIEEASSFSVLANINCRDLGDVVTVVSSAFPLEGPKRLKRVFYTVEKGCDRELLRTQIRILAGMGIEVYDLGRVRVWRSFWRNW